MLVDVEGLDHSEAASRFSVAPSGPSNPASIAAERCSRQALLPLAQELCVLDCNRRKDIAMNENDSKKSSDNLESSHRRAPRRETARDARSISALDVFSIQSEIPRDRRRTLDVASPVGPAPSTPVAAILIFVGGWRNSCYLSPDRRPGRRFYLRKWLRFHDDMVSGRIAVTHVDSIDAANRTLARQWAESPQIPNVPVDHVMACCMRSAVEDRKVRMCIIGRSHRRGH